MWLWWITLMVIIMFILLNFDFFRKRYNKFAKDVLFLPKVHQVPAQVKSLAAGIFAGILVYALTLESRSDLANLIIIIGILYFSFSFKWANKSNQCNECGKKL